MYIYILRAKNFLYKVGYLGVEELELCSRLPVMEQDQTCGKLKTQEAPQPSVAFQCSECCKNIWDGCLFRWCQQEGTSASKRSGRQ